MACHPTRRRSSGSASPPSTSCRKAAGLGDLDDLRERDDGEPLADGVQPERAESLAGA